MAEEKPKKSTLRRALDKHFSLAELDVLCSDIQEDLAATGRDIPVSLEHVGGDGKLNKIQNLLNCSKDLPLVEKPFDAAQSRADRMFRSIIGASARLMAAPAPESSLQRRVVLLGASNVARGIATALASIQQHLGARLDILIACGHGRSYGMTSTMLGRSLPGIAECGLWNALRQRPLLPTFALLTDIGNDLLFSVPVPRIAGWVEHCLQCLSEFNARITLTELPLATLATLTLWRFRLLRTLFFPGRNRAFADVVEDAKALNERIQELAQRYAAHLLKPQEDWYGFDPIHIKIRQWPQAWRTLIAAWPNDGASGTPARGSLADWLYLRWLCPEQRVLFGIRQTAAQPVGRLYGDIRISIY